MPETEPLSLPIELGPSKRRYGACLLGSLGFVVLGGFIVPKDALVGYATIGFFGLCAAVFFLVLCCRIPRLVLTAEGFRVRAAFGREQQVYWRDTEGFASFKMLFMRNVIWWPARPPGDVADKGGLKEAFREKMLPDSFGMRPEALAALMNRLRENAVAEDHQ